MPDCEHIRQSSFEVNHRLESRMREIRLSGSEGGGTNSIDPPYPYQIDETMEIARQIADAREAAHEKGIVHCDLKPANIKSKSDGAVKVWDFGLAKVGGTIRSNASMTSRTPITIVTNWTRALKK